MSEERKEISNFVPMEDKEEIKQYLCSLIDDNWYGTKRLYISLEIEECCVPVIEYEVKKGLLKRDQ